MTLGVIGRKCGMTRVFLEDGVSVPVTVIEVAPNRITQVRTAEADGYRAVQVTTGSRRASRVSKALAGHFAKTGTGAGRVSGEFRLAANEGSDLQPGGEIKVDIFKPGQKVSVTGTSLGKGFQGTIKRHHFTMGDATHGNSLSHRAPGSIGQRQTPGRVFPGKKMSGHLGNVRRTALKLEVVRVDAEKNLLLVKGAVPGSEGGDVIVRLVGKA
jgi:large subunit ribosomal protein L3